MYYPRLQRDGWRYLGHENVAHWKSRSTFEKPLPRGWILRKFAHEEVGAPPGKGCYWDEHELERPAAGRTLPRPEWEWADLDGSNLVWTEKGCLYRAGITADGPGAPKLLQDFNGLTFRRLIAPY